MFDNALYIAGQLVGLVAVALGFISFQMKNAKELLLFQLFTGVAFCVHYFLIGAVSAVVLNFLSVLEAVYYYFRRKNGYSGVVMPLLFILSIVISTILTWEGARSMFIMVGLVVSSFSFAFFDAPKIRLSNFIKAPLCLIYNIIVLSGGGIIYESATIISSAIGVIRDIRRK